MGALSKLLILSVAIALVAVPAAVSREARPVRGLKKALLYAAVANGVYYLALRLVLPRL